MFPKDSLTVMKSGWIFWTLSLTRTVLQSCICLFKAKYKSWVQQKNKYNYTDSKAEEIHPFAKSIIADLLCESKSGYPIAITSDFMSTSESGCFYFLCEAVFLSCTFLSLCIICKFAILGLDFYLQGLIFKSEYGII